MIRVRLLITLVVILVVAVIAVAIARRLSSHAAAPVAARTGPTEAGRPAAIALRTMFGPDTHGNLRAVELDLARGFHFDPRAAEPCTEVDAHVGTCPSDSTIGHGTGTLVVTGSYLPRSAYPVDARLYVARPLHRSDLAGVVLDLYEVQSKLHVTLRGRIASLPHGPFGVALRFSRTNTELPRGYDLSLLELGFVIGAHRTVGHVTYNLLTNPNACSGPGWTVQLLTNSSGRVQVYRSHASCEP